MHFGNHKLGTIYRSFISHNSWKVGVIIPKLDENTKI